MGASPDLIASLALAVFTVVILMAHRLAGAPTGFERVVKQGATPFLRPGMMDAGYWMLQPAIRACARNEIPAAAISWFSLVPAVVAGIAAGFGHWGFVAWSLLASALLDVMDGAVARAVHTSSKSGSVLDSVLDRYAEAFFFFGALAFYRQNLSAQLVVLAAFLGSFLIAYSTAKAEAIQVTPPRGWMKRSDRISTLTIGTGLAPLVEQWSGHARSPLAWPVLVTLGVIAVLANVSAVQRFIAIARPTP